jgi:16S rRNA processing protein RimM
LKGEVRIEQIFEDDSVFEAGRRVRVSGGHAEDRDTEIELFRRQHGRCVAKFRGIDSISDAERYIGAEVRVPVDSLPALEEGSFYTFQLKGCSVVTTTGELIGIVTDVLDPGGTEILKVDGDDEETLIPFAEAYLKRIDLDQRTIEVDLPEDLRNLNK